MSTLTDEEMCQCVICGRDGTHFYRGVAGFPFQSRCSEHEGMGIPLYRQSVSLKMTKEEFLVFLVMES